MKKTIFSFSLFIFFSAASAQFSIGPKINLGAGRVSSKNLKDNLGFRNQTNPDIQIWDIKYKFGSQFGLGAYFEYNINDNFSLLSELTLNSLSHKITMDYFENDLDGSGDGDKKIITSEAQLKFTYFNFPLLAKYSFEKIYALGGLSFNFIGRHEIFSNETKKTETYSSNILTDIKIETDAVTAELNVFKTSRADFVLGIGTFFDVADRKLSLDLRYYFPLTKTEMYTTSIAYEDNTFKNNEHFDVWGKTDAEIDARQYPLNDFKMSTISISISYALFEK